MSVVGFDFGTLSCTVCVVRKRGVEVLQNNIGKRSTETLVAFGSDSRIIGAEAVAQAASNAKNTVSQVKRLLGRTMADKDLEEETKFLPYKLVKGQDNSVAVEVTYNGKKETFVPEQITAAMFHELKAIAEAKLEGQRVVDCVISCPPYWTDGQRRAMLDAANIAGLNVLRLMNETTAVALNYGLLRKLPTEKSQEVLFVDMGHSSFNTAVVSFIDKKLTVLSTASDEHLGGRSFDLLLLNRFAAEIKAKHNLDVLSNVKATLKLMKECGRVKKVLSANSECRYAVEYIMNDTDVQGTITRQEFEEMAAPLIERMNAPLKRVLERAGKKIEDLHSLEVVGGAHRIPMVQKVLSDFFGNPVSKTCDGDESVARGCALQCAMLGYSVRVKSFEVQDVTPYPVSLMWEDASESVMKQVQDGSKVLMREALVTSEVNYENKSALISMNNSVPTSKLVSFKNKEKPFELVALYEQGEGNSQIANARPVLGRWVVSNMPAASTNADEAPSKIKVKVRMDLNGLLNVSSAQLLIPVVEKAVEASADEKTADKDTKMTDAPADAAAADSEKAADTKMDTTADTAAPAAEAEAKPVQPPKKKMKRVDLVVEGFSLGGLSKKTLEAFHEKEVSMCNNDRIVKETNDAMNALESYALEMRSRIQDDYDLAPFCTSDLRESFTAMLRKMEDWLYDEGFDCQKSEYVRRLTEVTAVGNPIEARKLEESKRSGYISDLKALIGRYQQFVTSTDKKYEHITAEERAEVQKLSDEADAWLTQSIIAQDALLKSVDPVLTLKAMTDKAAWLNNKAGPIVNKKAPPPPPKEEPKKEEEDKENKSAEANTQAPAADAAADAAAKPEEATTDADAAAKADAPAADADMSEKSAEAPAADADADAAMDTATE